MAIECSDWNDLDAIRNDLTGDYVLVNDIDENSAGYDTHASETANNGEGWEAILDFEGQFNGSGYYIADLYQSTTSSGGFFGRTLTGSVLKNVGIKDCDVSRTSGGIAGALVRMCRSDIVENCWSSGSVYAYRADNSYNPTGGLIGQVISDGNSNILIKNCYSTASVTIESNVNSSYAGGLVGIAWAQDYNVSVEKSYATGNITGDDRYGGFFGRVIAEGPDVIIDDNFWDTNTSGTSTAIGRTDTSGGGQIIGSPTGKTTAEMKDRDTFTDTNTAGLSEAWDMATVDTYDATKTWGIGDLDSTTINDGYPFLMVFQETLEVYSREATDNLPADDEDLDIEYTPEEVDTVSTQDGNRVNITSGGEIEREEPDDLADQKWLEENQFFAKKNVVNTTDEGEHLELEEESAGVFHSSGYRVSSPLSLDSIKKVESSNIKWTSTEPTDTDLKIYTAISDSDTVEPSFSHTSELYDEGDEFSDLTGGWVAGDDTGDGNQSKQSDHLYLEITTIGSGDYWITYVSDKKIDLTPLAKIKISWARTSVNQNYSHGIFGYSGNKSAAYGEYDDYVGSPVGQTFTRQTDELDVSGVNEEKHILVCQRREGNLLVYEMWGEDENGDKIIIIAGYNQ